MAQKSTSQRGATAGGRRGTSTTGTRSGAARSTASRKVSAAKAKSATRSSTSRGRATGSSSSRRRASGPARRGPRASAKWVPLIVLAIVVAVGWTMWPALKLEYQTSRNYVGLQRQYQDLKTRNASMEAQVAELKTPQGVEKAARENLGFVKAGEHAYVVMESGAPTTTPSAAVSATVDARPAWQVVLDLVFGVPSR